MTHELDDVLKELDDAIAINKDAQINAYLWAMDEKLRAYIERTRWRPISELEENVEVEFFNRVIPSEAAANNGAKPFNTYGVGAKRGPIYTGILGPPTHFKYLDAPPTTTEGE